MKILLMSFLISVTFTATVEAKIQAALFKYVKGNVFLLQNGIKVKAMNRDVVFDGDTVIVESNSLAILDYQGKSIIKIEENTEVKVSKVHLKGEELHLALKLGSILMKYVRKNKEDKVLVETKTAALGVRGTEFLVAIDPETEESLFAVNEGKVIVVQPNTKDYEFVTANKGLVTSAGKISKPYKFKWMKKIKWDFNKKNSSRWKKTFQQFRLDLKDRSKKIKNKKQRILKKADSKKFFRKFDKPSITQKNKFGVFKKARNKYDIKISNKRSVLNLIQEKKKNNKKRKKIKKLKAIFKEKSGERLIKKFSRLSLNKKIILFKKMNTRMKKKILSRMTNRNRQILQNHLNNGGINAPK